MNLIKCPYCGKVLTEDEKILYKCLACNKKIESDFHEGLSSYNNIGRVLKAIGIIIMVVGTIGGLIIACGNKNGFPFASFITMVIASIVSGMMFLGFSEIIRLLQDINNKLKLEK